jgi:hypothetical protein
MIRPNVDDVLAVAIETLECDIAPHVEDEYIESLCRTVSQLLRSARARAVHEGPALHEDNSELRALLVSLRDVVPAEVAEPIDRVLAAGGPGATYRSIAELEAEATSLRAALTDAIDLIEIDTAAHADVQTYLQHQLERQRPWLVDAFTGPRR